MNVDSLKEQINAGLTVALSKVVEGAQEDLQKYVVVMTSDLAAAVLAGREDLALAVANQAKVIGELNRVRATNAGWGVVTQVVSAFARGAIAVGMTALKGGIGA